MGLASIAAKLIRTMRTEGVNGLSASVRHAIRNVREQRKYGRWIEANRISPERRAEMAAHSAIFQRQPKFSIILPVYNVEEKWLRLCIQSVLAQIYPVWELCVADDASPEPHIARVLEEYRERDNRIKVAFRPSNGHISAASNTALDLAEGDFVVLLDHDDELSADALYWAANELNENQETVVIYSDEDLIDENGERSRPKFKPDFSRDLFYSFNLLTHLSVFEIEAVRRVGGFRIGFEGSQDYDLALRVVENIREEQIRHIPRILYHWRSIPGSVAFSMNEKPYAHERARRALTEHFERTGVEADIVESVDHLHRVRYHSANDLSVSVILMGQTSTSFPEKGVEVIRADRSAQALNDAAKQARGDVLLFLDAGFELRTKGTIDDLASFAFQGGIGAVGAKILSEAGVVEQCGLVLTPELNRALAHAGFPRGAAGDMSRNRQIGNFSAISVSCMAIRRDVFESVGGFDVTVVPSAMFDVDLCLRLRTAGKRIITLPHVELIRRAGSESVRGGSLNEMEKFRSRWAEYVERDPFCNPNLKRDGSFEISSFAS